MTSRHAVGEESADGARHPLDPLSAGEIRQAVSILAGDGRVSLATRFVSVSLREPCLARSPSSPVPWGSLTATLVQPRPGGQGRTGMTGGTFGLLRGQGGIEPDEPCRVCLVEFGDGFPRLHEIGEGTIAEGLLAE
jgi:hypothetical protein